MPLRVPWVGDLALKWGQGRETLTFTRRAIHRGCGEAAEGGVPAQGRGPGVMHGDRVLWGHPEAGLPGIPTWHSSTPTRGTSFCGGRGFLSTQPRGQILWASLQPKPGLFRYCRVPWLLVQCSVTCLSTGRVIDWPELSVESNCQAWAEPKRGLSRAWGAAGVWLTRPADVEAGGRGSLCGQRHLRLPWLRVHHEPGILLPACGGGKGARSLGEPERACSLSALCPAGPMGLEGCLPV